MSLRYLGAGNNWHVFAFEFRRPDGRIAAAGLLKGAGVRRKKGMISVSELSTQYRQVTGAELVLPALPEYAQQWLDLEHSVQQACKALFPKQPI